ncbi:hypothetical protein F5X68DRAFT_235083 [Plectosphaerella plurivora]|uniref:Uncharacterized protein n=1 Tax=Plectosphaerella plurivora TaxID=936078 RepID=A0A9P8V5G1_9PEZI|nr:hypothetical protein F5X68DRAFT_235083 [Plectosphaerella plurivora]
MNSTTTALLLAVVAAAIVAAASTINKRGAGDFPASVPDEKVSRETRKHPLSGSKNITTEPWGPEGKQTLEDIDWPVDSEVSQRQATVRKMHVLRHGDIFECSASKILIRTAPDAFEAP